MKSDLYTAIAELAAERNMPRDVVIGAVEHALKTVYKRSKGHEGEVAGYQVRTADGAAFTIPLLLTAGVGRDVFMDQITYSWTRSSAR